MGASDPDRRAYWRTVARELREHHSVERSFPLFPDGETPVDGMCRHLHPVMDLREWFEVDDLLTMMMDSVAPWSWEEDSVSADCTPAFIVVHHRRDIQQRTETMLTELVRFVESLDGPPTYEARPMEAAWLTTLAKLKEERLTFDGRGGEDVPLTEVADMLAKASHLDFVVSHEINEQLDLDELVVELPREEASVDHVLGLIVDQVPSMAWTLADEAVVLHLEGDGVSQARMLMSTECYDVRALFKQATVPLLGPEGEAIDADEPFLFDPARLEEYIRNGIGGDTWEQDPYCSVRITENGLLIMTQAQDVHGELRRELSKLYAIRTTIDSVPPR